jgi:pimeloyl-ACP methyl ester carboxylesterase
LRVTTFLSSCLQWGRNSACPLFLLLLGVGAGQPPEEKHLIYLHGRIVQTQQSRRPLSDRFGYYELDAILDAFRNEGFVVHGEIRPKRIKASKAADHVVAQVRELLDAGVRPQSITVVGASMGAEITLLVAERLGEPEVRFAVLGPCLAGNTASLKGRVLAIREESDDLQGPCQSFAEDTDARDGSIAREIVLHTGLSHGFLYRPMPEWVEPVIDWARR